MLTKFFTAVMVFVTGLLPSSCTSAKNKNATAQQHATNSTAGSVSGKNKNLGDLSLTNHYETYIDLGAGKSCTITPYELDRKNLRLTVSVETKNPAGKTADLNVVQVVGQKGKSFEVAIGDLNLILTPKLAE